MKSAVLAAVALSSGSAFAATSYSLVKEYTGSSFFDDWVFYDNYDNTTSGDVEYVSQTNATSGKLAYVNSNGAAIIKVDNTTYVPYNDKRDSVRITTADYFEPGSVIIFDAAHMPYGCSIWPSFWTKGQNWPDGGEIDIMEGINGMTANQMALHTDAGCNASSSATFSGTIGETNCNSSSGCQFSEAQSNSYGEGFAAAGGGVFATLWDNTQIAIWFWTRSSVPSSVSSATSSVDISDWGTPSANYTTGACDLSTSFAAQQLVLDITMCGTWAGVDTIYEETCTVQGTANASSCYLQNVFDSGNQTALATAYFEINYIKAFNANGTILTSSGTTTSVDASSALASATASGSSSSSGSSSAVPLVAGGAAKMWGLAASAGALFAWTLM
ncbi:glycoside hydrolase family 16 protein [Daedalea quercina L-15889]|uniref:Glycoside hydrolase family 16 protein n=1 Tax=Daedalea quercina L-15889 TaxID=1314783 RepID=A0A165NBG8_9APHY|nr:glycoside hydrolase family 16 protein [Daedalea quercina L-15889]